MEDRSDQGKGSELRLEAIVCPWASLGMGHHVEVGEGLGEPCWMGLFACALAGLHLESPLP